MRLFEIYERDCNSLSRLNLHRLPFGSSFMTYVQIQRLNSPLKILKAEIAISKYDWSLNFNGLCENCPAGDFIQRCIDITNIIINLR